MTSFGSLHSAGGVYGGARGGCANVAFIGIDGFTLPSPATITGANIFSSGYAGTFYFATRLSNAYSAFDVTGIGGRSLLSAGGGSGAKSWVAGGSDIAYAGGNGANGIVIGWEYS
ncbi:hypothetical protein QLZ26_08760 [Cronobacter universalis]|uniref:hypothetical protein n=1 Tax=Cronobacter universalis TaxID=535744 RepID=UPI0024AEEA9E|nr:hypothetical protein [Cronobacter universalis]MDI7660198.1 hypothetical protein [Cronobacter universalis]